MKRRNTIRACLSLFRIHLAEGLQYRLAALSGGSISVFWALIEIAVITVFYTYSENSGNINGLTLTSAITYIWLAQICFMLQPMSIDGDIRNAIVKGDVGIALCRPLDLYAHWFFKTAAGRLSPFLLRLVPVLACAVLLPASVGIAPPASLLSFLLFLASLFCAFLLCTAYGMLVTAIRLNITWGEGPTYMLLLIGGILSGSYLPLRLWPDSLQIFLRLQPFAGYLDLPANLYIGLTAPGDALFTLGLQLFWTLAFILLGKGIMRRKLAALIVQGG